MNRTKPLLTSSFRDLRVYMSTKIKLKNHYETLNIGKDSTQEEIKTAYYELTKLYHPDRNTTQEAKQMFQDVSNAYEILSNFQKRKLYDRDLMTRGAAATKNTNYTVPEDEFAGFHRSRSSNVNTTKSDDVYRNYDFDAWTKAHYGQVFKRQLDKKRFSMEREAFRTRTRIKDEAQFKEARKFTFILTFVVACSIFIQVIVLDYDNPVKKKK